MRKAQEREFHSFDQAALFYRHWPAIQPGAPARAIVLLHRGHEHSGRVAHLVDELDLPDTAFFAWDARGNGRSPGQRGDAPGFDALVRDLDSFIAHIGAEHGIAVEDIVVIAQSVGAVVAATWVHDYAPRLRALVLASPAFKVKLYVPFARTGLAMMQKLRGNFFVNSYVKPQWLTHDQARVDSYRNDPLITRPISVRVLLGLYAAADRVVADAQAISVPLQLLVSGADFVVHRGPQDRFYERLSSPVKQRVYLPGFFHDTLGERDRMPALASIRSFIQARFAEPLRTLSWRDAHRHGPSFDEAEILAWPPQRNSLADLRWRAVRAGQRLARSASVEELRGQLQDDQPCPVCGSAEHPYHQPEALLQSLTRHDEEEEASARAVVDGLKETLAQLREKVGGLIAQQKEFLLQQELIHQEQQALAPSLQAHPLHEQWLAQDPAKREPWLTLRLNQLQHSITQDEQRQNVLLALQKEAAHLQQQVQRCTEASQLATQQLAEQQLHLNADSQRRG